MVKIKGGQFKFLMLVCTLPLAVFLLDARGATGASLSLGASSRQVGLNERLAVSVNASSPEEALNAVSGVVEFPHDKLEVVSVAKTGSIVSLWLKEPSFSNSGGKVSFEGVAMNPGFKGANGKIMTITFVARKAGHVDLRFSSGSVLANDGSATSILSGLGQLALEIAEPVAADAGTATAVTTQDLLAPVIMSTTFPQSGAWTNSHEVGFAWEMPEDATGASYQIDNHAISIPDTKSEGLISGIAKALSDGDWNFHLRLKNKKGWSESAHYNFKVDTVKPHDFRVSVSTDKADAASSGLARLEAVDDLSGIDHYSLIINQEAPITIATDVMINHQYALPKLPAGKNTLVFEAIDRAGNVASTSVALEIKVLPPPVIKTYPEELLAGDVLTVRGFSQPNSLVRFNLGVFAGDSSTSTIKTDASGNFSYIVNRLEPGNYALEARAVDQTGAASEPTPSITIKVKPNRFGWKAFSESAYAFALLSLLIVSALIFYWKIRRLENELKDEASLRHQELAEVLTNFKTIMDKQIAELDSLRLRQRLTREEIDLLLELNAYSAYIDKFLSEDK